MELTSVSLQDTGQTSSSALYNLGDFFIDSEGFKWIYTQANAALTAHQVLSIDEDAFDNSETQLVPSADTMVYLGRTYPARATLTDYGASGIGVAKAVLVGYRGVVTVGPAKGETFTVDNNSGNVIYLKDPLVNHAIQVKAFNLNVVEPTPVGKSRAPVGITPVAVTKDYYFWRQVSGVAEVLSQDSSGGSIGYPLFTGGGTTGAARVGKPQYFGDDSMVGSIIVGSGANNMFCWAKLFVMG